MTIRSIDMQVLVQKVGEVARIQQAEKTGEQVKQQSFLEQIAQQTETVSKTVNQTPASESSLIREKQSDRKKKSLDKKKARQNESEDDETVNWPHDPDRGSNLDVRA
jgi:hypothetical protein